MTLKGMRQPQCLIPNTLEKIQGTISVVLIWKCESPVQLNFHNPVRKYVVPYMLTAE